MQSAYVTLRPGRAVVVFDPARVTAQELAQAVIRKTPYRAELLSVVDVSASRGSDAEDGENCLIFGLFCS